MKNIEKECKKHGLVKHNRNGKYYRCSKCASEATAKRRKKLKLKAVEYKGSCCSICNYDKCIDALEFHHLDPSKKDFGISKHGYTRSWEKVKNELDKCILVCSNCHKEIHSE